MRPALMSRTLTKLRPRPARSNVRIKVCIQNIRGCEKRNCAAGSGCELLLVRAGRRCTGATSACSLLTLRLETMSEVVCRVLGSPSDLLTESSSPLAPASCGGHSKYSTSTFSSKLTRFLCEVSSRSKTWLWCAPIFHRQKLNVVAWLSSQLSGQHMSQLQRGGLWTAVFSPLLWILYKDNGLRLDSTSAAIAETGETSSESLHMRYLP
jgi:hypothetical protein